MCVSVYTYMYILIFMYIYGQSHAAFLSSAVSVRAERQALGAGPHGLNQWLQGERWLLLAGSGWPELSSNPLYLLYNM